MSKFLAASAGLALAAGALAGNTYGPGAGGAIPDGGGPANPLNSTINVGDSFSIASVSVTLNNFNHTFIGDLIVSLSNGSTSIDLVNRPGLGTYGANPAFGTPGNYGGTYTFEDGGANMHPILMGNNVTGFVLPSGTYATSTSGDAANSLNAAFAGQNSAGAWTLSISDNAAADTGSLGSWSLTLTPVPAPGAAALMGLAGVARIRRRR